MSDSFVVIDFETTGLSPDYGDMPTEVGLVIIRANKMAERFHSLINPGIPIPADVVRLTGISDDMVKDAPDVASVMKIVAKTVGSLPIVAHNASFDRKFYDHAISMAGLIRKQEFYCSMRVARRVYRGARNHKLGTLVQHAGLKFDGDAHRAMADAEMTASVWNCMREQLMGDFGLTDATFDLMTSLQDVRIADTGQHVKKYAAEKGLRPNPSELASRDVNHQKTLPARLVSVRCITCGDRVTATTDDVNRWVKCPGCGFNTPVI